MSIYQELILDHYKNPRNFGTLENATKSIALDNPFCGDKIRMDVIVKDGKIKEIKFSGQGCAISQASASMLTEYTLRKKVSDLQKLDKSFILKMLGIELSPNRLKCALLPLEVLQKCLNIT